MLSISAINADFTCGKPSGKAKGRAWPWIASLHSVNNEFFCGGTLIGRNLVLTVSKNKSSRIGMETLKVIILRPRIVCKRKETTTTSPNIQRR